MDDISLIVVSNQLFFRRAVTCFLNSDMKFRKVIEVSRYNEIIGKISSPEKFLLLIDAALPDSQIIELIHLAEENNSYTVIFSFTNDIKRLTELIHYKAKGYLTCDLPPWEFLSLLGQVIEGKVAISQSLLPHLFNEVSGKNENNEVLSILTPREKEILRQLASGATNREIANSLVISVYTVKNHVHSILDKLKVNNRSQLVSYAINNGLVSK